MEQLNTFFNSKYPKINGKQVVKCLGISKLLVTVLLLGFATPSCLLAQVPGGVSTGLMGWYKTENSGSTSSIWGERSNAAKNMTIDIGIAGTNIIRNTTTDLINFNPTYTFNGGILKVPSSMQVGGNAQPYALIGVAQLKSTTNGRVFSSDINNHLFGYWQNRENPLFMENTPSFLNIGANSVITSTLNTNMFSLLRTSGEAVSQRKNGIQVNSNPQSSDLIWRMSIGGWGAASGETSNVIVGEYIQYNADKTGTDINRIESYLAIKYGLTLGAGTAINYVNSTGAIIWTGDAAYQNNVFGIGRDDISELKQRISKAAGTTFVTLSTDNNFTATSTSHSVIVGNNQFLLIGSNGASATTEITTGINAIYKSRVSRTWKVANTGLTQTVNLKFTNVTPTLDNEYYVITHSTTDFSSVTTPLAQLNSIGEVYNVTLYNGDFFTLVSKDREDTDSDGVSNINDLDDDNDGILDDAEVSIITEQFQISGTADEGGIIVLTAPAGSVFTSVNFASYGTPTGTTGSFQLGSCHATNSLSIVEGLGIGNNSFSVNASNTVFGDPCSGFLKRLYITAIYEIITQEDTDTDNDGIINRLDLDSDNDGIPDNVEAQITANYIAPGTFTDANTDGVNDLYAGGLTPVNTDGDGLLDYLDTDSDNDGIADVIESQPTTGYVAPSGADADGDGIDNAFDVDFNVANSLTTTLEDTDGDLIPDMFDLDSDGDGLTDEVEANQGIYVAADADNDGLADVFDNNVLSTNPTTNSDNNGQTAISPFPNTITATEGNWRSAFCVKPGITAGTALNSYVIISTMNIGPTDLPVNNGYMVLDSKTKGMVITRITTANLPTGTNAIKGMLVYDTTENCLKMYNGTLWGCIVQGCPD